MPTHTENKARRREGILKAARALISESEDGDFSMESLSQRAGVSIVTPYKLIGSKSQIIAALHEWETSQFQARIGDIDGQDPISKMLLAMEEAMDIHLADERYFKVLCREALIATQLAQDYSHWARDRFFLDHLEAAAAVELVDPKHNIQLVARVLANLYLACLRDWALGGTPSGELKARMGHAIALTVFGIVVRPYRAGLRARLFRYQNALEGGATADRRQDRTDKKRLACATRSALSPDPGNPSPKRKAGISAGVKAP
jgi:AcrR family transcriptional regulator